MWSTKLECFLNQYPDGICTLESTNPGPTVTIVGCTHGNEIVGIEVFDYLLHEYKLAQRIQRGKVQLILANIKAAKQNTRFAHTDLNRIWNFPDQSSITYEAERAKAFGPILLKSYAVLDRHSTANPSHPMILPVNERSFPAKLSARLHSNYIIRDIFRFLHGKALVQYVSEQNPNAQCFVLECAQDTEEATLQNAQTNSLAFLRHYGIIPDEPYEEITKEYLRVFKQFILPLPLQASTSGYMVSNH